MALVPEMNEIPNCYSEMDELFYEEECPYYFKSSLHDLGCSMNCSVCELGIQLKNTNQKTLLMIFKKAVVIVLAVEKMKNIRPSARLFVDEDLHDILNNVLVEEAIPFENFDFTYAADSVYRYFSSSLYKISDTSNKSFALNEFPDLAQLVALHLQGLNSRREVKLNIAVYSSQPFNSSNRKNPVALGIMGRNLYLSCVMVGGRAQLRLEELNHFIREIRDDSLLRFIFFKSDRGSSASAVTTSTFESAACPNWYICTSQRENEPVSMAQYQEQSAIIDFKLIPDNQ
ncbi:interleukin-1 beta-like [Microcaecilia unicolor]|uniref:Interleukin-1 n=1 Tax=Microcaecilia unicolor TaxID=1415580 RepID=A0A6P7XSG6_9AMPH|nr:interleukin-1 beta-like [Microcaecilia unicolor]